MKISVFSEVPSHHVRIAGLYQLVHGHLHIAINPSSGNHSYHWTKQATVWTTGRIIDIITLKITHWHQLPVASIPWYTTFS